MTVKEAPPGAHFDFLVDRFRRTVRSDPTLRSRLRRCCSTSDTVLVPEVHRLRHAIGDPDVSTEAVGRIAILAADSEAPNNMTLGHWLARIWGADRSSGPSREWRANCESHLDALLRTSDPDMLLRLLRALVARAEGKVPFAAAARAIVAWERLDTRQEIGGQIAREYAAVTSR